MAYPIGTKLKAIELREKGYSIKEIAGKFQIANSTSSLWMRNVNLSPKAQNRLKERHILGQYKTSLIRKEKREKLEKIIKVKAEKFISDIDFSSQISKLICTLLYWAEGAKQGDKVGFMNSDPLMIRTFLTHFRNAFDINESKLRGLVHIHEYHDDLGTKKFWSDVTNIPLDQFNRSYLKPHTSKNERPGYRGCLSISYCDVKIVREIKALYNVIAMKF